MCLPSGPANQHGETTWRAQTGFVLTLCRLSRDWPRYDL